MGEDQPVPLDSSRRLRAITSPLRRMFVDALSALGPASVREVAEKVGKPASTLYYHLRQLEDAGIVREVAERPTGKRPEKVYELVSDYFRSEVPPKDAAWRAEVRRHIRENLRTVERSLGAYLEDPRFGTDGDSPRFQFRVVRIHLGPEELRELSKRLEELTHFLTEAEKRTSSDTPPSEFVVAYAPAYDTD